MASTREFFETLESRVDPAKAAGVNSSYLFDVTGAGTWKVDVQDSGVQVTEGNGETFKVVNRSVGQDYNYEPREAPVYRALLATARKLG